MTAVPVNVFVMEAIRYSASGWLVLQRHFVILGVAVPDAERPPVDHRGL
jgi:hypothetical protein